MSFTFIVATSSLLLSCSTPSTVEPLSITLDYERMVEAPRFEALPECARLSGISVDAPSGDEPIGQRWIEGKEDVTAPVTVSSDLAAWVRSGAIEAFQRAGASIDAADAPSLELTLDRIKTQENVLRRAGYDSKITLSARLVSGGTTCWSGRIDGADGNYGYAGNSLAYHEMLNEALDVAMIELLEDEGFRSAICSCR